jgi:hypothetical protein
MRELGRNSPRLSESTLRAVRPGWRESKVMRRAGVWHDRSGLDGAAKPVVAAASTAAPRRIRARKVVCLCRGFAILIFRIDLMKGGFGVRVSMLLQLADTCCRVPGIIEHNERFAKSLPVTERRLIDGRDAQSHRIIGAERSKPERFANTLMIAASIIAVVR